MRYEDFSFFYLNFRDNFKINKPIKNLVDVYQLKLSEKTEIHFGFTVSKKFEPVLVIIQTCKSGCINKIKLNYEECVTLIKDLNSKDPSNPDTTQDLIKIKKIELFKFLNNFYKIKFFFVSVGPSISCQINTFLKEVYVKQCIKLNKPVLSYEEFNLILPKDIYSLSFPLYKALSNIRVYRRKK